MAASNGKSIDTCDMPLDEYFESICTMESDKKCSVGCCTSHCLGHPRAKCSWCRRERKIYDCLEGTCQRCCEDEYVSYMQADSDLDALLREAMGEMPPDWNGSESNNA